jgi:hypothetical protein
LGLRRRRATRMTVGRNGHCCRGSLGLGFFDRFLLLFFLLLVDGIERRGLGLLIAKQSAEGTGHPALSVCARVATVVLLDDQVGDGLLDGVGGTRLVLEPVLRLARKAQRPSCMSVSKFMSKSYLYYLGGP